MDFKLFEEDEELQSQVNVFLYDRRLNDIEQTLGNEVNVHHWGVIVQFPTIGYTIDAGKSP